MKEIRLGIDVGGSGIKGALVDLNTGELQGERKRFTTPFPGTPGAISETIKLLVDYFEYDGPIGIAFPAAIQKGIVRTASNIHKSWLDIKANDFFSGHLGLPVTTLNDADAAGTAEMQFGHGKDIKGTVLIVTVGSGLGTALFTDGKLLPNTELGHIYYKDKNAEKWASDATRKRENLSWKKWAKRFDKYLHHMEKLFYPELIIIGGGTSKKPERFMEYITRTETNIVMAHLQNHAGIIGAAVSTKGM